MYSLEETLKHKQPFKRKQEGTGNHQMRQLPGREGVFGHKANIWRQVTSRTEQKLKGRFLWSLFFFWLKRTF